ncbi:MBL fold metallo-hydrolase [Propionicimonas sp.]|uniref:MBL fold metallo-hydrolase n=1 Tax=Propionicimonas sp. TaxID=1955623 RepID=UPI00182A14E9|nr:MBL fold metallo-hydrolase [Propionicimonas sp.]MBU3976410.1 MBL fold metallo-hydrolase [Actinomycetota bacterium]MBA3021998.1 MBL fold metallo-hydrolase [Propionicimonas sp.]MBU3987567.1 MBL fold metallo-hydrolase [Actinomycetota bacterium]MBU4006488.1 MBL fold metallo-hydrolase [Actinomycetota bacterium]MBU4065093.1 MBL fold metallo-hydrolase [Actinomycetota bacterium]
MTTNAPLAVTYIGGPTALLEYAGLRILLDPTFDEPGDYPADELTKTAGPGLPASAIEPVDLVLLSHHAHADNFDAAGKQITLQTSVVLSTPEAQAELGAPVIGMAPWQTHQVGGVQVTALPGLHGPRILKRLIGPVIGFLLQAPNEPTIFVSGDNSSLRLIRKSVRRLGTAEIAFLFAGAARVPPLPLALTLTSPKAARAAKVLGANKVVGLHVEDWAHFSESRADLESAFAKAGIADRLVATPRGVRVSLRD